MYSFEGLLPGSYEVAQVDRDGWVRTFPTPPPYAVDFTGEDVTGLDFGNARLSSIAGQKFEDLNGNGQRDADEPGLNGWTIELVDTSSGQVVATAVTTEVDLDDSGMIEPVAEAGLQPAYRRRLTR